MSVSVRPRWDIFCNVVDNFGDIGVCWRLARQLFSEHGMPVRLWINDLESFARIWPEIDPALAAQSSRGVDVRRWRGAMPGVAPADVVIETFGCEVPEDYQVAMAARARTPVWINLEYLSAESWVSGCHGLPSPHPRLPLTKYYFFPGFTAGTGGLLRERELLARRAAFLASPHAQAVFWQSLQMPAPRATELSISLFCYENPAIPDLLQAWAAGPQPVRCLVPDARVTAAVTGFFAPGEQIVSGTYRRQHLEVRVFPLLAQERYDELLWSCDCNFVRGEDSFVRAQWAGRPLVWHIYPQKENAHWVKLNAFIALYASGLPGECLPGDVVAKLRDFWRAWNSGRGAGEAWPGFWQHRSVLQSHAHTWLAGIAERPDLVRALVQFCNILLK